MRDNTSRSVRQVLWAAIAVAMLAHCSFDQSVPPPLWNVDSGVPDAAQIDADPTVDTDNDGVPDVTDNCPNIENSNQSNNDGDTFGDICDNCPTITNQDQMDVIDGGDGIGDACDDEDNDGAVDALDNCWSTGNAGQENNDKDSYGDACDNCVLVDNEDQLNSDGDSYGDVCDNCAQATNEEQFDEDNDAVGDVCDNCPSVRNANQANILDTDGVGDACDPRPHQSGDSILFFEGFPDDSAGIPPGWYQAAGSGNDSGIWSVNGGKLRQSRSTNSAPAILWRGGIGPGGDGVLGDVLVEILAEAGGVTAGNDPYIGTVAGFTDTSGTDRGYGCATQVTGFGTQLRFLDFQDGNPVTDLVTEFAMDTGTVLSISHYQYGGTHTVCQGGDATAGMGRAFSVVYAAGEQSGVIGIMTSRIATSIRHLVVYELGGPVTCSGPAPCF